MKFSKIQINHIGNRQDYLDRVVSGSECGHMVNCLLDGHQTNEIVDFVSKNIVEIFFQCLEGKTSDEIKSVFNQTFHILQKQILDKGLQGGTTVSMIYTDPFGKNYFSFVGDSPCYKKVGNKLIPLNHINHNIKFIHKNGEYERISESIGSEILDEELQFGVLGNSQMTRRLGDGIGMEFGVTYEPFFTPVSGTFDSLVFCSDGVADYFDECYLRNNLSSKHTIKQLMKTIEKTVEKNQDNLEKDLDNATILILNKK